MALNWYTLNPSIFARILYTNKGILGFLSEKKYYLHSLLSAIIVISQQDDPGRQDKDEVKRLRSWVYPFPLIYSSMIFQLNCPPPSTLHRLQMAPHATDRVSVVTSPLDQINILTTIISFTGRKMENELTPGWVAMA